MRAVTLATVGAVLRDLLARAQAVPRERLVVHTVSPAGLTTEVCYDDPALARAHLARLASTPTARAAPGWGTTCVLDGRSLGLESVPAWSGEPCSTARFREVVAAAGLRAAYPSGRRFWQVFDPASGIGVEVADEPADRPVWDLGAPLRQHLHWLLSRHGVRLAHGATLGRNGRGVLLLGDGGAGKSGTTLAGLSAGLQTAGDDYVAVDMRAGIVARSVFRVLKQDRAGLDRIGGLAARTAHLPENWQGKVEFDPEATFRGAFVDEIAIAAVLLPRLGQAREPRVVPVAAGEAMRTLMHTNLYQNTGSPDDGMAFFGALVRQVPCYQLALSTDARANGACLAAVIDGLR